MILAGGSGPDRGSDTGPAVAAPPVLRQDWTAGTILQGADEQDAL